MASWKSNVIVAVRFRDEKKHILQVKWRSYKSGSLVPGGTLTRQEVISYIESGCGFVTAYYNSSKRFWQLGEDVHVVSYGGQKFIRTDNNSVGEDNLQSLPEF